MDEQESLKPAVGLVRRRRHQRGAVVATTSDTDVSRVAVNVHAPLPDTVVALHYNE